MRSPVSLLDSLSLRLCVRLLVSPMWPFAPLREVNPQRFGVKLHAGFAPVSEAVSSSRFFATSASLREPVHSRLLASLIALLLLAPTLAFADAPILERTDDPPVRDLAWQVVETEHFSIHYTEGLERVAATVADLGDRIHGPITTLYDYEPPEKTSIILRDHGDIANGAAAYFQNRIEIWASNLDYEFRSTHDWLRDVFTHEFTHIVQLGAAKKGPAWLPQIYFQWFRLEPEYRSDVAEGLPNTLVSYAVPTVTIPMWFAEGVAQYQVDQVRADWWDPHRGMVLRVAILSGTHLTYREMEGFYDHDGREAEMVYDHGFAFVRYLASVYGDSALRDLTREMTKWHTWSFDRAIKRVTGRSGSAVYDKWITSMRSEYEQSVAEREAEPEGELLETPDVDSPQPHDDLPHVITPPEPTAHALIEQVRGAGGPPCHRCESLGAMAAGARAGYYHAEPAFSPDGKRLAYVTNEGQDYHLAGVVVRTLGTDTTVGAAKSARASSVVSWFADGNRLVFSRAKRDHSTGRRYNDLIIADLEEEEALELTKRWRATYPDVSPDGSRVVFVRNEAGSTNLWMIELDTLDISESAARQLTHWTDGTQVFSPRWSPDGTRIAVSIARAGQRDIQIMRMPDDPDGEIEVERTIASPMSDRDPAWTPDGTTLVFSSALHGVFDLYELSLQSGDGEHEPNSAASEHEPSSETSEVRRITNAAGGAFSPSVAADGRIAYSSYEPDGYTIRILPADHPRVPVDETTFDEESPSSGTFSIALNRPTARVERIAPHFMTPALLPRFGLYDGKVRLGAYAFTGDLWDSALLLAGLWVAPDNLDYDAFVLADVSSERLRWPLSIDAIRTVRYTAEDTVISGKLWLDGVEYGLNSIQVALKPSRWTLDFNVHGSYQRYDAAIDQTFRQDGVRQYVGYNYTYFKGAGVGLSVGQKALKPFTTRDINPAGYRWLMRYDRWRNDFFADFDQNSSLLAEEYTRYEYGQATVEGAYYLGMPWHGEHRLGVEGRAMLIDAEVDSFFYEGIGGIIGLRGYTYYQLQGRKTAWAKVLYRMPVPGLGHIDRKLGPVYFDKVYLAGFAEAGRVWRDEDGFADTWTSGYKRDVGIELRADLFSFYGYPSRLGVTYARALDAAPATDKTKWYLTMLFGYL